MGATSWTFPQAPFDKTSEYEMILPDDDEFHDLDLGADLSDAIAKAEGSQA